MFVYTEHNLHSFMSTKEGGKENNEHKCYINKLPNQISKIWNRRGKELGKMKRKKMKGIKHEYCIEKKLWERRLSREEKSIIIRAKQTILMLISN